MAKVKPYILSFVVPVYNEAGNLASFNSALVKVAQGLVRDSYEIIYCDDGSTDDSAKMITDRVKSNPHIKLLKLSRNFGKETASTAGLTIARGEAIITIDADGQHPVEVIPKFVKRWRDGAKVVIGLRLSNRHGGTLKRWGSKLFHKLFNRIARVELVHGSTDFRLIDSSVQADFKRLTERNRITRGLIDWLGYRREFVEFHSPARSHGQASYSYAKLFKLAIDSFISMSLSPLYISAYIGAVVLPLSTLIGITMLLDALVGDPLGIHAKGSAYLVVLLLFLVGVLLVSQGIIGLYLSHIHAETQNRPLFIIDKENSLNLDED